MSLLTKLPNYTPERFVNREPEQVFVLKKVDSLLEGDLVEKRTVIFTGEHGMGKSWLLQHLQYRLQHELKFQGVITLHIDLAQYMLEMAEMAADVTISELLSHVQHKLFPTTVGAETTIERKSYKLIEAIKQQILSQRPLILFVDSVYEAPRDWLARLEDYLLAPLAAIPRVLLVMAGRGQPYPWKAPELRLRADFYQDSLPPFQLPATQQQLAHQIPMALARVNEIYQFSRGNPKANLLLASNISVPDAFNQIIEEMLASIPLPQRHDVRNSLEALAILRQFDQTRVPIMLKIYDPQQYDQLSRRSIQTILDGLLKPELAFWNKEKAAYTFHPFTRNMALQYLIAAQPELWQKLTASALDLYLSWVRQYPQNQSLWQEEADYHERQLRTGGRQGID